MEGSWGFEDWCCLGVIIGAVLLAAGIMFYCLPKDDKKSGGYYE